MTWKLLLKNKKIRIDLSQALPKYFLGFILVVLLSSDDFTEDRNVEKLIERFPDEPYSSLIDIHFFFCSFFMKLFTDFLQHRFSFPIPLQFFLSFEHFLCSYNFVMFHKIEGLGIFIICMRRFNVLLQML